MSAVFGGFTRPDTFRQDTTFNQPYGHLAQPPQTGPGKGRTVVRTQHLRHPAFPEHPFEAGDNKPAIRCIGGIAGQHNPAAVIGQREGMAPATAGMGELPLEIGTPDIVWPHSSVQLMPLRGFKGGGLTFFNQTMTAEQLTNGAGGRNAGDVQVKKALPYLLRPPQGMLLLCLQQQLHHGFRCCALVMARPGTVTEGGDIIGRKTGQPLVTGFTADIKAAAHLSNREAAFKAGRNKLQTLHGNSLSPGHGKPPSAVYRTVITCYPCARFKVLPMCPVHTKLQPFRSARDKLQVW